MCYIYTMGENSGCQETGLVSKVTLSLISGGPSGLYRLTSASNTRSPTVSTFSSIIANKALKVSAKNYKNTQQEHGHIFTLLPAENDSRLYCTLTISSPGTLVTAVRMEGSRSSLFLQCKRR